MSVRVCRAELLRLGILGLTWREIGPRLGIAATTACRHWRRFAAPAQKEARARAVASQHFRGREDELARLIAMGRRGLAWRLIGAEFYPDRKPQAAADAAQIMFSRHAAPADKKARRQAMQGQNCNRTPGLSPTAARRRDKRGVPDWQALPEFTRPWAGMGECFA